MRDDRRNKQPQQVLFQIRRVRVALRNEKAHDGRGNLPHGVEKQRGGRGIRQKDGGGMVQHHGEDRNEL